jgi:hypothetical protein
MTNYRKFLIAAIITMLSVAAFAGNTTFLTDRNGQVVFPISPPNRATSAPGAIDNMTIGATTPAPATFSSITSKGAVFGTQGAPATATVSATLTAANLAAGIITVTQGAGGASAQQLPLATAMDTLLPASVANTFFDFFVINLGAAGEVVTITTNTGWTLVGDVIIDIKTASGATPSSAHFRARKTATGAWTLYRLA